MMEARMMTLGNHCWLKALSDVRYCSSLPQTLLSVMTAFDHGWLVLPGDEMAQPLENLGKSYMPIGYYRIDLPAIEVDTLYEFDTVHFINVTKKLEIESCPYMVAQLHHGEVVHVYGAGEDNASFFNEEGSEVAPLATLSNGRRRVHVRLPYFGTTDEIDGWMTVGSWVVPMKMYRDRPDLPSL